MQQVACGTYNAVAQCGHGHGHGHGHGRAIRNLPSALPHLSSAGEPARPKPLPLKPPHNGGGSGGTSHKQSPPPSSPSPPPRRPAPARSDTCSAPVDVQAQYSDQYRTQVCSTAGASSCTVDKAAGKGSTEADGPNTLYSECRDGGCAPTVTCSCIADRLAARCAKRACLVPALCGLAPPACLAA